MRFPASRTAEGVSVGVSILLLTYGAIVVALFASGSATLLQAGLLLGGPVVLGVAVLRPEWTILILVALPPSLVSAISPMRMVVIMLATLFGFLLSGHLSFGIRTGVYPLVGILLLAMIVRADTPAEATAAAGAMLKLVVYYTLLMLVAFHAAAYGRLRIDTFLNALLLGLVAATIVQPFISSTGFEAITSHPFQGSFSYVAAIGFGVTYVRLSLTRAADRRQYLLDAFLMLAFLALTAIGFVRVAWMASLAIIAFVSRWTDRKSIWIVSSLFFLIALTVPVVGQQLLPGGVADIGDAETLSRVTTGRSVLWGDLWQRGADALPLGHGWGYIWSLSSNDIFGFAGEFTSDENPFVFPHNDFLYLFVELGFIGLGLLVVYWLHLLRKIRLLSRSRSEPARFGVRVLVPVIIVMFLVQLFDNGFAIRFIAEKFFIAAGLVFGLQYSVRESERLASLAEDS